MGNKVFVLFFFLIKRISTKSYVSQKVMYINDQTLIPFFLEEVAEEIGSYFAKRIRKLSTYAFLILWQDLPNNATFADLQNFQLGMFPIQRIVMSKTLGDNLTCICVN